jgi:hypothetical protein
LSEISFPSKKSLKKWLISTSGIVLSSISLMGGVQDIEFQFTSAAALSTVMESSPEYFPEGEYVINYSNSEDLDHDELDYSRMVMVVSFEAKLARSNNLIGGLKPLLHELSEFEFCSTINRTNPAYVTAGIWVVEPTNPVELSALESTLAENAVFYAFNDGSGFVTESNGRMGNGISNIVTI